MKVLAVCQREQQPLQVLLWVPPLALQPWQRKNWARKMPPLMMARARGGEMKRRDFLKAAVGGATTLCTAGAAQARPNLEPAENAVGMLYDSTLCVGCKACVAKCKEVNDMPPTIEGDNTAWDSARDLSGETLNVIKIYKDGTAKVKDSEVDGFAFEKRSCMHCVDPGCVSVCPCTAMRKESLTGIVTHHPDVCIGCRNCMVGCPYNVPQFEYNKLFGQIHKCQMCNQAGVERISKGGMTGCAEVCPTGATLFGTRKDLLAEAKRRMALKQGEIYNYPRGSLSDPSTPMRRRCPSTVTISGERRRPVVPM